MPMRSNSSRFMKARISGLAAADGLAHQTRQQIAGAAVVVPARLGLDLVGQRGGERGDVVLPGAEQHRDDVGLVLGVVADRAVAEVLGFAEAEAVRPCAASGRW